MATGTTYISRLSRNDLIREAYQIAGGSDNDPQFVGAVRILNSIIREYDKVGEHLWAEAADPTTLSLSADVAKYTVPATNMARLISVVFRDSSMRDIPIETITGRQYNKKEDKLYRSSYITRVYLSEEVDLAARSIFVWPVLSSVNSQSEVIGTDTNNYVCVRSNTGDVNNRPITGTNYRQSWELGGSSGVAWVNGTSYTSPQLLIIKYARPLYDFASSEDDPDIPGGWDRFLKFKLALDLSYKVKGFDAGERVEIRTEIRLAETRLFDKSTPQITDYHDKIEFF